MVGNTIDALKGLYGAVGGDTAGFVANTIPDAIAQIAGQLGVKDINVQPEKGSATLFGTKVSSMQSGLTVADGAITGELKFIEGGLSPAGPLSGDGNFMALKFVNPNEGTEKIEIRLNPTEGTNWVELDEDMNAVCKVASTEQKFEVRTTMESGTVKVQVYDLSGLDLKTE